MQTDRDIEDKDTQSYLKVIQTKMSVVFPLSIYPQLYQELWINEADQKHTHAKVHCFGAQLKTAVLKTTGIILHHEQYIFTLSTETVSIWSHVLPPQSELKANIYCPFSYFVVFVVVVC